MSDVASGRRKAEGGFYDICPPSMPGERQVARAAARHRAATRSPTGSRGSRRSGATAVPEDVGRVPQGRHRSSRRRASPTARPSATPSATRPPSPTRMLWAFGGAETDQTGKKVVLNSKGDRRGGEVHAGVLEGRAATRAASPGTTPTTTGPSTRARSRATLNGASIYIVAKRQKDKIKDDKGEPMCTRHRPRAAARPGPAGAYLLFLNHVHAVMKYSEEPEAGQGLPAAGSTARRTTASGSRRQEGYSVGATKVWEKHPMWARVDEPLKMFRTAARNTPPLRLRGAVDGQGHRGLHQVHRHRHVRQGRRRA